jgi:hypothetical protein
MSAFVEPRNHETESARVLENGSEKRQVILGELNRILESSFFRNSNRAKQFLKYVVEHKLSGNSELLKERTIGAEVFQRPPGYSTGDDSVVRVQAGEVRRRLDQYYQAGPEHSEVRIDLPVGSYTPVFRWPLGEGELSTPASERSSPGLKAPQPNHRMRLWLLGGLCAILALGTGIAYLNFHQAARQKSILEQFWAPVFATQQPVLICLAKGITYRPTPELYQRYARNHPGAFQTEVDKSNEPLPLDPDEKLSWKEMSLFSDYGVASGDVSAAVRLSALLGRIDKPSQVRIGTNYSFEDLRNSPAVVVGAFNNKWTMHLTSNLHFAFVEDDGKFGIREQIPGGRVWSSQAGKLGETSEDFAIVSRLLDSKTGQFTITAAGITGSGTEAAGEFASNSVYLEAALRNAPANWQSRNLQVVLQTTITDSVPGPPHAVAFYSW